MVRELAREERIVAVRVIINDRPGVLADIAATIGEKGGNILEVLHHRTMLKVPPKGASLDVTFETHGPEHAGEIVGDARRQGLPVERLDPPGALSRRLSRRRQAPIFARDRRPARQEIAI